MYRTISLAASCLFAGMLTASLAQAQSGVIDLGEHCYTGGANGATVPIGSSAMPRRSDCQGSIIDVFRGQALKQDFGDDTNAKIETFCDLCDCLDGPRKRIDALGESVLAYAVSDSGNNANSTTISADELASIGVNEPYAPDDPTSENTLSLTYAVDDNSGVLSTYLVDGGGAPASDLNPTPAVVVLPTMVRVVSNQGKGAGSNEGFLFCAQAGMYALVGTDNNEGNEETGPDWTNFRAGIVNFNTGGQIQEAEIFVWAGVSPMGSIGQADALCTAQNANLAFVEARADVVVGGYVLSFGEEEAPPQLTSCTTRYARPCLPKEPVPDKIDRFMNPVACNMFAEPDQGDSEPMSLSSRGENSGGTGRFIDWASMY